MEMINIHLNVKSTYFGNTGKRRVGAPDVTKPAAVIMRPENQTFDAVDGKQERPTFLCPLDHDVMDLHEHLKPWLLGPLLCVDKIPSGSGLYQLFLSTALPDDSM